MNGLVFISVLSKFEYFCSWMFSWAFSSLNSSVLTVVLWLPWMKYMRVITMRGRNWFVSYFMYLLIFWFMITIVLLMPFYFWLKGLLFVLSRFVIAPTILMICFKLKFDYQTKENIKLLIVNFWCSSLLLQVQCIFVSISVPFLVL